MRRLAALLLCVPAVLLALPAFAQTEPQRCPRLIASQAPRIVPAGLRLAQAAEGEVGLTFIGHASFLIESPAGVTIVTDYSDWARPAQTPRIATMNIAHSSHHTFDPDPDIEFVLHGWGEDGAPARHELTVEDVWLRNVTTNIRGGTGRTERDQNSIFVFEVAGLCIAHLGHLHHTLTDAHLDALGRIDVVLAPVDGSYTPDADGMLEVLREIRAPVVVPMHYFSRATLETFLARMEGHDIVRNGGPSLTLSRASLPGRPTVLVLPGH